MKTLVPRLSRPRLAFAFAVAFSIPWVSLGQIAVPGGVLAGDTLWDDTTQPYIIDNLSHPVIVPAGVTLTVAPGVTVQSTYDNGGSLQVRGTLAATGASFEMLTRDVVAQPIIVEENGTATFTGCSLTVDRSSGDPSPTTALIVAKGAATLTLAGSELGNSAVGANVNRGVWTQDTATLTVAADGATPTTFSGFPEAILLQSTTAAAIADADFATGTYAIVLDNPAVDLTVADSTFLNFQRALQLPQAGNLNLTNIGIDQTGAIGTQTGVYAYSYTSLAISGAISNMNVGVHVSTAHSAQDVSAVVFTNCNWGLLAEGDWNPGGRLVSVDTTLAVAHYHVDNPVTIQAGATLTLQPGTILDVKNLNEPMFVVDGTLDAEGAIFDTNLNVSTSAYNSVIHARNSGAVNLTECRFVVSSNSTNATDSHKGSCVNAVDDAVVDIRGSLFETSSRYVGPFQRGVGASNNAAVFIGAGNGTRTRFEGFRRGVVHESLVDLRLDGVDFVDCNHAVVTNTIRNFFAYNITATDCGSGFTLTDLGVLVTDGVVFENTRDALVLGWNRILSPQISTAGITFGANSYCTLPGNYTLDRNLTMRALPYRLRIDQGQITIPAGFTLTFPAGSEVATFNRAHVFNVYGTLNASETDFNFETRGDGNDRCFRFFDNAGGTFTQCAFRSKKTYSTGTAIDIFHLLGDSHVVFRGCAFDGMHGSELGRSGTAVATYDNATARIESYAGTPSTFAHFATAVWARYFHTFPYVATDSTVENCDLGATVHTGVDQVVDRDVDITCPWLVLTANKSVTVQTGARLRFMPGSNLTVNGRRWDGFFFVDGTVRFEAGTVDANIADHNYPLFVIRNSGRLEFVDTQVETSSAHSGITQRLAHLSDTSSLLLQGASFISTARRGYAGGYAFAIYSPTVVVSAGGAPSHFAGFREAGIYTYGLQPLAGTPNLTFADNVRDIGVRGGYTLSSDLTLPPGTRLGFHTQYGTTTVAAGATLTVPAGGHIDNFLGSTPRHALVVAGAIAASDSRFDVAIYHYDSGSANGTDFLRLTGDGVGTFTNCQFLAGGWSNWDWNNGRIFDLEGSSSLTLRGGTFETPALGRTSYRFRVRSAVRLRGSSRLTIEPQAGEGTVIAGFGEAILSTSDDVQLTLREAILRGNTVAALRFSQFPAAHTIAGNTFIANATWALDNQSAGQIDARDNFWGHPSGPRHPSNPLGLGEAIRGDVLFQPYMGQGDVEIASLADHSLGQAPNAFPAPGAVADAVVLRFSVGETAEPTHCYGLRVRITGHDGMVDGSIANLRLFEDVNGDGLLDGGDTLLAPGVVDLAGNAIDFELDADLDGDYLVVADFAGLKSGDSLSLGLTAEDMTISPAQFIAGSCAGAHHYLDRLMLSGHPAGRVDNAFLAATNQPERPLFGFHLNAGYAVRGLTIRLTNVSGLTAANLANARLLVDVNGNGREDFGDTWHPAENVTLAGTTGSIYFAFGANPVPTGVSFVLFADFVNLRRDYAMTVGLPAADINAGDSVVVTGSAPASSHTMPAPLMLIDAPFQAGNGFVAASQLNSVPLLTFTLTPSGRRVEALNFELYDVEGIPAAAITNARVFVDVNQNGRVDPGETTTVGGYGTVTVDLAAGIGRIRFDGDFTTVGGDYILVADVANLTNDDTLTITLGSADVEVPVHDLVEGGVSPVRHAVYRPDLPQAARQTNWTLSYRSPGGLSVTGAYSNDDQRVVVGYSSGTAFTFDADVNAPQTMFHRHFDMVQYAGFSADDSQVVTVTRDGAVYLWNSDTGEMENNLFSDLLVRYAVPSPDASKLFIVTEGKALLLDMTTGAILWEFVTGTGAAHQMYAADYAPDGSKILVGHQDKRAYLLDAETGAIIRDFRGHSQAVVGANFAANGTVVMTSSTDSTVTLWPVDDNVNPISTVDLGTEQSLGSGVSRDGSRVAILTVLSGTRRLRMYDDLANLLWQQVVPYTHFTGTFSSLRFNTAGDRVLICSNANSNRDLPAALAVQYSVLDGQFLGFVGPRGRTRGRQNSETYQRPRVSEDGNRIFYMHTEGLDVIFPEPGRKIIEFPDVADEESFDITPDGRKMVYTHRYGSYDYRLRYLAVDRDRVTPLAENPLGHITYGPLTLSRTGGLTILGDVLYRTLTGSVFTQSPNPPAAYRSAFSPDESLWGLAFYNDMSIKTMFVGDESGSLEYGVTLTNPYKPVKILYHPDGVRVGCVDEYSGVQFYRLDNNNPVGLYDFRSGSGIPRLHDAVLSHDGTMLAIARGNSVKLFDMRTGRVLRYFYPTHSGQADCQAYAVGFGARDNMLWIGWSDSYIEVFNRSRVRDLRLNPVARTLPVGRSQQYTVRALYDDGSSVDVTPEYLYRATGAELTPGARLYASPPEAATIEAGKVTVNPGASGDIRLTAVYTEGGRTVTAEAILTVGQSPLVALIAQPEALTLAPGVLTPIEYTALFADGYQERVTSQTELTAEVPDQVRVVGNNVTVLSNATPGDVTVTGAYVHDGVVRTAPTVISIHGPESRWEREVVTPGGDTLAMAYSPNGQLLAIGSSSGAISIYRVGATTTAYELETVLPAHQRPVTGVWFRNDTRVVSAGLDGRISQWDLTARGSRHSEFQHEAVIMAKAVHQQWMAFGDNLGRVALFNLDDNAIVWMHERHTGETTTVAVDGTHVMSGGQDRRMVLMNRADGAVQMVHTAFARPPVDCRFDGNQMVVLSGDKRLARWDKGTEDGNLREFFFPAEPTAMTLHGGRTYVATANNGANAVWIYDANGLLIRWLEVSPAAGMIASLAVTPNGEHVLSGRTSAIVEVETEDGEVEEMLSAFHSTQFWHINRGSYSGSLAHSHSLNDAAISADGSLLFTQSARRIYRWGLETGRGKVLSGTRFLETGYFAPYDFDGLRMSGGAAGLIGTRVRSSIYLMHAAERLLHMSVHTDANRFGLSPDGTRMITNTAGPLTRFWDISLDFPTVVAEHPSQSADVAFLDDDDSLGSITADLFVSIFNRSGQRYSGIPVVPPGTDPEAPPFGGQLSAPLLEDMTASGNAQRVGIVVRYIEKDMFGGIIASHNYVQVYDLSDRDNPARIFDRFIGTVEGEIPPVAIALSHDGALLFYGLSTQDGDGRLHDLTANRELMLFLPPSTGTLSNVGPAAAQFFDNDAALMVAWTEGYAEVYRRAGLDGLRLSPAARSVAAGEALDISAFVAYAGGSEYEVTGRTEFSVEPPAAATVAGNTVTLAGGLAPGTVVTVTGRYEELGNLVEGTSTLTVQTTHFTHLSIDPPKVSMSRGQSITVRVFAHYADAGVEEVSLAPDLAWSVSPPDAVALDANVLTIPPQAQFGDVRLAVRLIRDGDERDVSMAVHIRQPGSMVNPGDFDGDLIVGFNDLIYFIGQYGSTAALANWDSRCDFDGNGLVDIDDATAFIALYGTDYRPARSTRPANLTVVSRGDPGSASVWLEAPKGDLQVGERFELLVYAQENHPEANGFRGGPITVLFDPERMAFDGAFNPANHLQAPFNSLFVEGRLLPDRIERLTGLTIQNGHGDGQPALYARLPFRALAAGVAVFETAPSTSGLALTPPVGRLALNATEYSGDAVVVIDLGGGDGTGEETEIVFHLREGWNLVGIPLHVSATRGGVVREGLQFYAWSGSNYQRTTEVKAGLAYWVHSDRALQLVVRGFPKEATGLPLKRGWNLIAPLADSPAELPPGVQSIYSWKPDRGQFGRPDLAATRGEGTTCQPGEGFWVLCTEDDVVLWPSPTTTEPRR